MFQQALNQGTLTVRLRPEGPVLVKSGREAGADPTIPDMNFVRTHHAGLGRETTVYLPGSSLKGTLRTYCERAARTVGVSCCDPFEKNEKSKTSFCGKKWESEPDGAKRHGGSCTVCRLFGNTALGARLLVGDAYPTRETVEAANQTEQRDGVGIDRLSGGTVPGALFTLEVVTRGEFEATLALENFELWQLGLLAIALRDLGSGLCPIGYGKSRGLGRMTVTLTRLEIGYPGRFAAQEDGRDFATSLYGVSAFDVPEGYTFDHERPMPLQALAARVPTGPGENSASENELEEVRRGLLVDAGGYGRVAVAFAGNATVRAVLKETVPCWKAYVGRHSKREASHG